jgi:hypothetical protein
MRGALKGFGEQLGVDSIWTAPSGGHLLESPGANSDDDSRSSQSRKAIASALFALEWLKKCATLQPPRRNCGPQASVKMQVAIVTVQHGPQAAASCTLPVLRCTEVSQPTDGMGHSRHFEQAQATSASHPIADISLRRTHRRYRPRLCENSKIEFACRNFVSISSVCKPTALATAVGRRQ